MQLEAFALDSAAQLPAHAHPTLHLCIVEKGGFVERDGRLGLECGAGTIRVSAPGVEHLIHVQSSGVQGRVVELMPCAHHGLAAPLHGSVVLGWNLHREMGDQLVRSWNAGDQFGAECAALELAAAAVRPPSATTPAWLKELRAEVDLMSDGRYSLADLAARCRMHRSHVARSFRSHFGRSIGLHVQARRTYAAASRLQETDQPLAALALDLGFADQAHFTRMFGRYFGVTPAAFRRRHAILP